ncbi:FKBP-type peptidyl-prolyl cis-trans isomerase [Serinibacter salmoneus]|uniref:Peptidyl-prolyl cis-trans isomerase n=1 Tax=Serinibacter salmoneus TaxID=556530 RepID=A0A2A9CZD9_9MICO|nr:peptidylprolyl isomerase [Serinibacter salmoneus]
MRHSVAAASLAALALLVTGCSTDGEEAEASSSASASEESATGGDIAIGNDAGFSASGAFGEKPTLTWETEEPSEELQVEIVSEGDGAAVAAGDVVVAHYLGQVFGSEDVFDNSYDRGASSAFSLNGVIEGWSTGLVGVPVGSRVLLTIPSDLGYGDEGSGDLIAGGDTLAFVVDVEAAVAADASGQADATPTDAEVPVTITGDLGSPVTEVVVADGAAEPEEMTVTVLAEGTGEPLGATDQLFAQYTLATWDNAESETTWPPEGPGITSAIPLGQGSAFDELEGIAIGSRVLLTIPAEGEDTQPLAVVIDLVDAMPGA